MAPPKLPKGEANRKRKNSSEVFQEDKNKLQKPSSSSFDNNVVFSTFPNDSKSDIYPESSQSNGTFQGDSIMSKLKEEFAELCFKLNVTEMLKLKAQDQWEELWLKEPKLFDNKQIAWFACALYTALIDSRSPDGNPPQFTVTDLLLNSNVHFQEFYSHMQKYRDIQNISDAVKDHLQQLGKHFCISSAMFYKFERIFKDVYKQSPNIPLDQVIRLKKLCWVFFLLCKASYRNVNTELIFCIQLLLSCVHYIAMHTISELLNPPYDNDRDAILNKNFKNPCELKPANEAVEQVVGNILKVENVHLHVEKLTGMYLETYKREGNINELFFLDHNPILIPLQSNDKEKSSYHPKDNSNSSPHRLAPLTPVSTAVTKVEQLMNLLMEQPDKPDDVLKEFFQKCNPNPSDTICGRIRNCEIAFVQRFLAFGGEQPFIQKLAQQRYQLIVKLYFRTLKSLLISEQRRLGKNFSTGFLHMDNFHRSLLACSAEVILMTYGVSWNMAPQNMRTGSSEFDFPWVLEVFHLKAYEFFLIIESFLRSEIKLSEEIQKHIQKVGDEILERFAWKEDSPVFDIKSDCLEEILEPPTSENGNDSMSTPTKNNNNNNGTSLPGTPGSGNSSYSNITNVPTTSYTTYTCINNNISPSSSSSPGPTESTTFSSDPDTAKTNRSLKHFFSKVFYLAHKRLSDLCQAVKVNHELKQKVWTCLRYCIISQRELLRQRHLDQIMMCCLFGICRVVRQDIKFKDIMTVYKELLHSQPESSHVFKVILLQNGDTDSIVGFYNKVFLPIMKNYLLQFNPARPSAPPLSPIPKGVTSSPVCSVAGKKNLHVSSVKSPIFKSQSQLTPRTSQLYCFGEGIGSAEKLRSINDSVAQSCVPNCQKRLQFDSLDNCARRNAAVKCLKFDGPDSSTSQSESTFKSPMSPAHSAARGSTTPGKETPQKKESPSAGPRHVTPNTKRTQRHLRFDDNQGSSENEASGSTAGQSSTTMENSPNERKENKIDK